MSSREFALALVGVVLYGAMWVFLLRAAFRVVF
jgi:hypothetical protein